MICADEGTLQDGYASTSRDGSGGEPTFPFAETGVDTHVNEVANSHQSATDRNNISSDINADENGNAKKRLSTQNLRRRRRTRAHRSTQQHCRNFRYENQGYGIGDDFGYCD